VTGPETGHGADTNTPTSGTDWTVPGDTNNAWDVFVREQKTGAMTLASLSGTGRQGNGGSFSPATSADGRYVAFSSNASNLVAEDTKDRADVFVRTSWPHQGRCVRRLPSVG
jgi:hypothetical protein